MRILAATALGALLLVVVGCETPPPRKTVEVPEETDPPLVPTEAPLKYWVDRNVAHVQGVDGEPDSAAPTQPVVAAGDPVRPSGSIGHAERVATQLDGGAKLARLGPLARNAIPTLSKLAADMRHPADVRARALAAAIDGALPPRGDDPYGEVRATRDRARLASLVHQGLADREPVVRYAALSGLSRWPTTERRLVATVKRLLKSRIPSDRLGAARVVLASADYGKTWDAARVARALIEDPDAAAVVRDRAAWILGRDVELARWSRMQLLAQARTLSGDERAAGVAYSLGKAGEVAVARALLASLVPPGAEAYVPPAPKRKAGDAKKGAKKDAKQDAKQDAKRDAKRDAPPKVGPRKPAIYVAPRLRVRAVIALEPLVPARQWDARLEAALTVIGERAIDTLSDIASLPLPEALRLRVVTVAVGHRSADAKRGALQAFRREARSLPMATLIGLLGPQHPTDVRITALTLIAERDRPSAALATRLDGALVNLLDDPHPMTRALVAGQLRRAGKAALPALTRVIERSPLRGHRVAAANAIAAIAVPDPATVQALGRVAGGKGDPLVRCACAWAASRLQPAEPRWPALVRILSKAPVDERDCAIEIYLQPWVYRCMLGEPLTKDDKALLHQILARPLESLPGDDDALDGAYERYLRRLGGNDESLPWQLAETRLSWIALTLLAREKTLDRETIVALVRCVSEQTPSAGWTVALRALTQRDPGIRPTLWDLNAGPDPIVRRGARAVLLALGAPLVRPAPPKRKVAPKKAAPQKAPPKKKTAPPKKAVPPKKKARSGEWEEVDKGPRR